jgi:spore coat protein H
MWRWGLLVVVGVTGLVACGPEALEPPVEPGGTTESDPLPSNPMAPSGDPSRPAVAIPGIGMPNLGPSWGEYPPLQTRIPVFELQIAQADLDRLDADPNTNETVPVVVVLDGERAPGQVRYRGASTRDLPQKSFKIELDPGYELADRDHFELLAEWYDSAKLTEKFAADLYSALGLPVPRARYARVSVNGQPNGLYLDMEHVGKDYLKHHAMERSASIYRCGARNCELTLQPGSSYQGDFEKKTNEDTGHADLTAFLAWVNRSDDAEFEAKLERFVDVEAYLGNLAADALISNNIIEDSRSYWIHEHLKDRWQYTPWDLNNAQMLYWRTWSPDDPPITTRWPQVFSLYDPWVQRMYETRVTERPGQRPTWNVLNTRIWDRPALRERLIAKLEAALDGPFSEGNANEHIDALWRLVKPELERDPYISAQHFPKAQQFLKRYVRERATFLRGQLNTLKAHGNGPLVIREVNAALSLEGYELTNDLRATTRYQLPTLSMTPGQVLRFRASGNTSLGPMHLPFTLSRSGGEVGLFDGRRVSASGRPLLYNPVDAIYFGPLPSGTVYGRKTPQSEDFERRPLAP